MSIFLVAIVLVVGMLISLPLWMKYITESEGSSNHWQPEISSKVRFVIIILSLSLYVSLGIGIGKDGTDNWVLSSLMFLYSLYLTDSFLANRNMVLPQTTLESGENIYIRRFIFLFSLVMLVIWSLI